MGFIVGPIVGLIVARKKDHGRWQEGEVRRQQVGFIRFRPFQRHSFLLSRPPTPMRSYTTPGVCRKGTKVA